ncbi:MAG: hypothetical protein M5U28_12850 [Sandaracinaceae bacterium]|nr:hypothetical protein [Sandaracinaceae bacterium]
MQASPHDLLALKLEHAVRFMRGDAAGMRRSAEAALARLPASAEGYGHALGVLAFAREETGDYEGAERAGLEALEREPHDAWGAHAIAHVHEMRDRPRGGGGGSRAAARAASSTRATTSAATWPGTSRSSTCSSASTGARSSSTTRSWPRRRETSAT